MINTSNYDKVMGNLNPFPWYREPLMETAFLKALDDSVRDGSLKSRLTMDEAQMFRNVAYSFYHLGKFRGIQTERARRRREVTRGSYTVTARTKEKVVSLPCRG